MFVAKFIKLNNYNINHISINLTNLILAKINEK